MPLIVGCSRAVILSDCNLQVSSFLFRSVSRALILVWAIASSLVRNSILTASGFVVDLGFFLGLELLDGAVKGGAVDNIAGTALKLNGGWIG